MVNVFIISVKLLIIIRSVCIFESVFSFLSFFLDRILEIFNVLVMVLSFDRIRSIIYNRKWYNELIFVLFWGVGIFYCVLVCFVVVECFGKGWRIYCIFCSSWVFFWNWVEFYVYGCGLFYEGRFVGEFREGLL